MYGCFNMHAILLLIQEHKYCRKWNKHALGHVVYIMYFKFCLKNHFQSIHPLIVPQLRASVGSVTFRRYCFLKIMSQCSRIYSLWKEIVSDWAHKTRILLDFMLFLKLSILALVWFNSKCQNSKTFRLVAEITKVFKPGCKNWHTIGWLAELR